MACAFHPKRASGHKKRVKALQDKDWATFANYYNGAGYKKRGYDEKMKKAYEELTASESEAAEKSL